MDTLLWLALLVLFLLSAAVVWQKTRPIQRQGKTLLSTNRHQRLVLLIGPSATGKTALYTRLHFGPECKLETVPSLAVNRGCLKSTKLKEQGLNRLEVIDIPGHPKLRQSLLWPFLNEAQRQKSSAVAGIVLMVNSTSSEFLTQYRDTAEFLYQVLAHRHVRRQQVPVLIACHFQDKAPMAFGAARIQSMLEVELDKVRQSKAAAATIDEQGHVVNGNHGGDAAVGQDDDQFLGFEGKPLAFEDLENEVHLVESRLDDIGAIEQWLEDLALHAK